MTDKELKRDIKEAKLELESYAKQVSGIFQLWHIFSSARVMCDAFERDLKNLSYESCMAYTKAIVVEYTKPWTHNHSKVLNSVKVDKTYPFLSHILEENSTHEELLELRDKMVAHIDQGYESHGLTLRGNSVKNFIPSRPKQEGTLDEVFFPISIRVESTGPIWWINNLDKIKEIKDHIHNCVNSTQEHLKYCAIQLRDFSFNHIHVLKHIPEVFKIEEFKIDKYENGKMEINYNSSATSGPTFSLNPSKPMKLGRLNIQGTVGAFEPSPNLPENIEIEGKGYRLIFNSVDETGKTDFNIIFPKYPYPKIKQKKKN